MACLRHHVLLINLKVICVFWCLNASITQLWKFTTPLTLHSIRNFTLACVSVRIHVWTINCCQSQSVVAGICACLAMQSKIIFICACIEMLQTWLIAQSLVLLWTIHWCMLFQICFAAAITGPHGLLNNVNQFTLVLTYLWMCRGFQSHPFPVILAVN